jgi:hypothetical protein
MEIGISINGVLRDFFGQIEEVHVKYFPPEEDEDPIKVKDYDLESKRLRFRKMGSIPKRRN